MAEEARQKYDLEMASYRQAGFAGGSDASGSGVATSGGAVSAAQLGVTYTTGSFDGLH
jgi:hypothetical protein